MKKAVQKVISIVLAVLIIFGICPAGQISVFGAVEYSLHKVDNLYDYVRNTESGTMSYITNLGDSVIDVHNNLFRAEYSAPLKRTCICLNRDSLPKKGETVNFKDVFTVTFRKAGYTSEGDFFNLECTLSSLKMTGMTSTFPDNSEYVISDIAARGVAARAQFAEVSEDGELVSLMQKATPFDEAVWSFRVTDLKGKTMRIPPILMFFKDIDVFAELNGEEIREGVQALSGFGRDIYINNTSNLIVSEGNSLFEGNGYTENEDINAHVVMRVEEPEVKIGWHGVCCGTIITPESLTGYPIPENTKTVDREQAEIGETLQYTIRADFPMVSDDNCAAAIRVTDTLDDILDVQNTVTHIYKNDADDDGEWELQKNGQTLSWSAKNPRTVEGSYRFVIWVKIRDDLILDGREGLYVGNDGLVYYKIRNSDRVEVTDHNGEEIIINPPSVPETDVPVGGISLVKDVDRSKIGKALEGEPLSYSFTIRNTGSVSLRNIELTDNLDVEDLNLDWKGSSDPSSGSGILLPGETVWGSAVYCLTQADIDGGSVRNIAAVAGEDPLGVLYRAEDTADTVLGQEAEINLVKDALPLSSGAAAGDRIEYRFEIADTGNTSLGNIRFTDDHELTEIRWDREFTGLKPGEKITGSAFYILTQEDVDNGEVINKAFVTAETPDGNEVDDTDEARTEISLQPEISLEKTSDPAIRTGAHAGDTVPFAFVITNTGNCTLSDIILEDELPGIRDVTIDWKSSGDSSTGNGVLSAGESVSAEAFYELTQEDIDRGSLVNRAAAAGTDKTGRQAESTDEAQVLLSENGEICLEKVSEDKITDEARPGDAVRYLFTVTNSGNVTLSGVSILDELSGLSAILYDWEGSSDPQTAEGILSPGETVAASADYLLTQDDIDAGEVTNHAKTTGRTPSGKTVEGSDDDLREIPSMPEISLVKEVNRQTFENVKAGDALKYTLTAANTGNCTLAGVSIEDELQGLGELEYDWSGAENGEGILKPGEIVRAQAVYTISQEDINQGFVTNTAEARGYSPEKIPVTGKDAVTTTLSQVGALSVSKIADVVRITDASVGDEIVYTMVARNMGNMTISNIEFTDEKEGLGELTYDWRNASGEYVLEPGESVTVHASYKITQADIEAESTSNTVIVQGRTPDGKSIVPAEASVTTPVERKDSIKIEKTADRALISDAAVGDKINYTIQVSNTGNTVLYKVNLRDELEGLSDPVYDWSAASEGEGTLLPGESMTAKAVYEILQKDIDSGHVLNTALAEAENGKGEPVRPAEDDAETKLGGKSAFTVTKAVDRSMIANSAVGDVLTYTITGKNTGSTTLTDVTLKDTLRGVSTLEYDWSEASLGEGTLLPGESVTATCTYSVTQADISNGKVENAVLMSAKQPDGKKTEKEAKIQTTLKRQPTPTPTPVRVNGTTGTPSTGVTTTTNNRTVTGSSPAQTGQTAQASRTGAVKTGDNTNAKVWMILIACSILAGGVVLYRKKKEHMR